MDRLVVREIGSRRSAMKQRYRIEVAGVVQGVGFRPLVYRLAVTHRLAGSVSNRNGHVVIAIEGLPDNLRAFVHELERHTSPPMRIDSLTVTQTEPVEERSFRIEPSDSSGESRYSVIPADLAVCELCSRETMTPGNRFYMYPFTGCTDCGPRYTIIHELPYDRERTSMSDFTMCDKCRKDYNDPQNRRFHAQNIACPDCGPQIQLMYPKLGELLGDWRTETHRLLENGGIIAVKGVGGFHLICDAQNEMAVAELRRRKHRPRKPLAVMAPGLSEAERCFELSLEEKDALASPQAPIVLVKPKAEAKLKLPLKVLAPGLDRLGVMLAYTPLHHLLFGSTCPLLVVTSGNASGKPIACTNEEAFRDLSRIADGFLLHDRLIVSRADDSVGQVADGAFCLTRRSRGYVPESLPVPLPEGDFTWPIALGTGAETKNTFCIVHNGIAWLSHHIGETDHVDGLRYYRDAVQRACRMLGVEPEIAGYDPHPGSAAAAEVRKQGVGKLIPVYHHHAHMASCMAEHQLREPVIGCVLDGTGYGVDGSLWGFDILAGDYAGFQRIHSLQPLKLPGGEAAIRYPWMMAVSCLYETYGPGSTFEHMITQRFPEYADKLPIVTAQLDGRIAVPQACGAGRLFDAVSALLGLCVKSGYDGEAAMMLGSLASLAAEEIPDPSANSCYPIVSRQDKWLVQPLFLALVDDLRHGLPAHLISQRFHRTVGEMVVDGAMRAAVRWGLRTVVLSGGVWDNRYLLSYTKARLVEEGFTVYSHQKIPAGDGGIAFGQAVAALWRWHREHVSFRSGEGD
ncbi:carbamoyltransferase HypF [Paenibacillus thalictri]|uniref:Carbamoyltransferase n=1 Tax=Paenibacillus thalictri TaxID=2527873 RepID=A0A4Q9DVJ7_9BACL|nr:carbamoyltransferase HypF [Paenibacillus thalictri]TBL80304.1 carbamoyltransferase HypF [Paenibacillus thalictri]